MYKLFGRLVGVGYSTSYRNLKGNISIPEGLLIAIVL